MFCVVFCSILPVDCSILELCVLVVAVHLEYKALSHYNFAQLLHEYHLFTAKHAVHDIEVFSSSVLFKAFECLIERGLFCYQHSSHVSSVNMSSLIDRQFVPVSLSVSAAEIESIVKENSSVTVPQWLINYCKEITQ